MIVGCWRTFGIKEKRLAALIGRQVAFLLFVAAICWSESFGRIIVDVPVIYQAKFYAPSYIENIDVIDLAEQINGPSPLFDGQLISLGHPRDIVKISVIAFSCTKNKLSGSWREGR